MEELKERPLHDCTQGRHVIHGVMPLAPDKKLEGENRRHSVKIRTAFQSLQKAALGASQQVD